MEPVFTHTRKLFLLVWFSPMHLLMIAIAKAIETTIMNQKTMITLFWSKRTFRRCLYLLCLSRSKYFVCCETEKTAHESIVEKISIYDVVHNRWLSPHDVIGGYDKATEKSMSKYDIHWTKIKCYNIAKALHPCLN